MRLNKYLSKSGVASRRKSDELIQMATTQVNGKICLNPAYYVKDQDIIRFDGKRIFLENEIIVLMLNKPKKVISTVIDTHQRKTVMDFIPKKNRLTPISRLDQDTTGLLLFTNDGDLQEYLTHPRNQIPKDYEAVIHGRLQHSQIKKIKKGIYIGDKEFGKAEVMKQLTEKNRSKVILRLRQGKKREIRRIFYRLKINLITLKRIGFSKIKLGSLPEGSHRILKKNEVDLLRSNKNNL